MIARAQVSTDKPVAYMRQLCKHFSHRVSASIEERTGKIAFEKGTCDLVAAPDQLTLLVAAADAERLAAVEDVVGRHLERFGRRDGLTVAWEPPPA